MCFQRITSLSNRLQARSSSIDLGQWQIVQQGGEAANEDGAPYRTPVRACPSVSVRPSTVEGGNEGANTLFGTVDTLFDTVEREGVGNEEGANLLLLPPLWSA